MTNARRGLGGTLALAVLLAAAGCSKDQEVNATLAEIDGFTAELVKKADAADPAVAVDEAQRFFDARKPELKPKMSALMKVRGFEITEETKKKITECATRNVTAVMTLRLKHAMSIARDPALGSRYDKLTSDYQALLTTP
jgi:hypothetical protein